jgi:hypothetical protein
LTLWSRSEAFSFQVGAGNVIKGWDQGLIGVKVGSRVQLDIPADLAYGDNPSGGQPAGALRFVVNVLTAAVDRVRPCRSPCRQPRRPWCCLGVVPLAG